MDVGHKTIFSITHMEQLGKEAYLFPKYALA